MCTQEILRKLKTHPRLIKDSIHVITTNIFLLKSRRLISFLEPLIFNDLRSSNPLLQEIDYIEKSVFKNCKMNLNKLKEFNLLGSQFNMSYIYVKVEKFISSNLRQTQIKNQHTVTGLGSRILLISFFALVENQGANENSALYICKYTFIQK